MDSHPNALVAAAVTGLLLPVWYIVGRLDAEVPNEIVTGFTGGVIALILLLGSRRPRGKRR